MNNIYAEILKRVENNEALTLKTEFTGSEGIMAESLKKTLAPYEPHTDMRGRCFADVTFEESDDGHSVAVLASRAPYRARSRSHCAAGV